MLVCRVTGIPILGIADGREGLLWGRFCVLLHGIVEEVSAHVQRHMPVLAPPHVAGLLLLVSHHGEGESRWCCRLCRGAALGRSILEHNGNCTLSGGLEEGKSAGIRAQRRALCDERAIKRG